MHVGGNDATKAIEALTHVGFTIIQIIFAGRGKMQHILTDDGFDVVTAYSLMKK